MRDKTILIRHVWKRKYIVMLDSSNSKKSEKINSFALENRNILIGPVRQLLAQQMQI